MPTKTANILITVPVVKDN